MTVTVTATPEPSNWPPRIRLDITSTGETSTTVMRQDANGQTVPVRTYDGNPLPLSANVGLVYDYEVPYGTIVTYSTLESPTVFSPQVSVTASQPWLIHPGVPSLSQPLRLRPGSLVGNSYSVAQGVFYPMGRSNPVIITDGARRGATGSLTALVTTVADLQAVLALLSDAATLLLNIPAGLGYTFSTRYVAIGDVTTAPAVGDKVVETHTDVKMAFTQVDRPVGGSQSERTFADLLAYPTFAALQAAYPSFTALLAGP